MRSGVRFALPLHRLRRMCVNRRSSSDENPGSWRKQNKIVIKCHQRERHLRPTQTSGEDQQVKDADRSVKRSRKKGGTPRKTQLPKPALKKNQKKILFCFAFCFLLFAFYFLLFTFCFMVKPTSHQVDMALRQKLATNVTVKVNGKPAGLTQQIAIAQEVFEIADDLRISELEVTGVVVVC